MPKPIIPTKEEFAERYRRLLPPGQAWAFTDVGDKLLLAKSCKQVAFREAINSLLIDILPQSTVNLLQEWRESTSLPDECSDNLTTNDREEVLLRLRGTGAESVEEYLALFPGSEIEEFFLTRVDEVEVDTELVEDEEWQHTWVLKVPEETAGLTFAIVDETEVGDPIEDFGNTFVCRVGQEISAHHFVFVEIL